MWSRSLPMRPPRASGAVSGRAAASNRSCAETRILPSFCVSAERKGEIMGRKVHPIGMRLGINQPWQGRWFAEGAQYRQQLHQDLAIRSLLMGKLSKGGAAANAKVRELRKGLPDAVLNRKAGVSRVDVERTPGKIRIAIHTAKPGILIGRKGEGVKRIRTALEALMGKKIELDIKEISSPDMDAVLVAYNIADQLERRIA